MKKIFLFLILLIPLTSALQFSPTSLEFNMEKNQISCKKINFQIESPTTIQDIWAKNIAEQWSTTDFKTTSREHGINVYYPSQINSDQKEIEVCLSGSNPGNYKGAIIFRQGEVGNSIVQFAVWLKVSISGDIFEEPEEKPASSGSKKSKSSGGSGSSNILWTSQPAIKQLPEKVQDIEFDIPEKEIKLTTKDSNHLTEQNQIAPILLTVFPIILIILLVVLLLKPNY